MSSESDPLIAEFVVESREHLADVAQLEIETLGGQALLIDLGIVGDAKAVPLRPNVSRALCTLACTDKGVVMALPIPAAVCILPVSTRLRPSFLTRLRGTRSITISMSECVKSAIPDRN